MTVDQLISALRNYPGDARVVIHVPTSPDGRTELTPEIVVDASQRNGMTGRIQTHRAAIVVEQLRGDIRIARQS